MAEGVRLANSLEPELIVLEGQRGGSAAGGSDARLLVAGAQQPVEDIAGYLGAYRLLISDAVVLTMAEEPLASREKVRMVRDAVERVRPGMPVLPVVFRPQPVENVRGRRVACFSTAPEVQKAVLQQASGGAVGMPGGVVLHPPGRPRGAQAGPSRARRWAGWTRC